MIVETFPVGLLQCNCTVLGCEETRRALVVDPGDEVEAILAVVERYRLTVETILHTHAHLDHLGATAPLARATGARVLLHAGDQPLYDHVDEQARLFGFATPPTVPVDRHVADGEELRVGEMRGEVLHTPGHTPGSLCLHLPAPANSPAGAASPRASDAPARLFSGDTLFQGSIGRTDLWGGDTDAILRSIRERLLTLPDATLVVPGHGPSTTIGQERRSNPFLRSLVP
ncbi:MAG: MBL fold metallo-hydrolase [Candidatus Eisenbacteria bacterium]|nr:MBL fold metallo-hydrolase [Candidatus Eisenbacteria bacterium]